ncbi:hypothetical protein P4B35_24050, partial [Pontiellaceae bacterium B12227]|nr:hypothetical protein [Pontiellaceae bacterium B12227]
MLKFTRWLFCFSMFCISTNAALVAHYDMTDGDLSDDELGNHPLTMTGVVSLNASENYAVFTGAGYLSSAGITETDTFTVSYWWRTADLAGQGNFQGPSFSCEAGSNQDWQFTKVGSNLDLRDTAPVFTDSITAYTDGTWYNTVIQSVGSSTNINIWISEEG